MTDRSALRLTFLGGVGEIGKNTSVFECGDDMIVVDAGVKFPESDQFGVDVVIPDYSYLKQNEERIRGLVLTHGHEDHLGAIPYLVRAIKPPPVYGTRLTLGLMRAKLSEWDDVPEIEAHEVKAGDVIRLGCFEIEFIHVNHSIPDSCGLAITTPVGIIVHSGDFKFDQSPIDLRPLDLARFAYYGERGVLAFISDSTNVEKPGYVASERTVGEVFRRIFEEAPGRVLIATFASNIHRIQQVIDVSMLTGRKVCVDGRSMVDNVKVACELGYLRFPDDVRIGHGELDEYDPRQITIITTGSQGEPMAALSRMAVGEHPKIKVQPGDTVIMSATPIPGNEGLIWRTINNLFRLGANVIYSAIEDVHVSGHANQEELKMLLSVVRPKFVIPFHGERRHQHYYRRMARELGIPEERIFLLEPYEVLEITPDEARVVERVGEAPVLVDGGTVGDVGAAVLRERRKLSEDGIVFVSAAVNTATGEIVDGPAIETAGFVYVPESEELVDEALDCVAEVVEEAGPGAGFEELEAAVRRRLSRLFEQRVGREPIVVATILEVSPERLQGRGGGEQ